MNSMLSYAVKQIIHRTSGYKRILKAINETENADRDALEHYQLERLIPLIRHCCRNVPYYSELFCRNGIVPEDIRQLSDIKKLPMLTREDILNNYDKLHAVNVSRRLCQTAETSGTTGRTSASPGITDQSSTKRLSSIATSANLAFREKPEDCSFQG
jgi:phenylacetate-coenzyme A ligase PaaK-like adenylate-forming protein